MQHINEAVLHEYLDRGPIDDALQAVADHVATCAECAERLRLAESHRSMATNILRAAAPSGMPVPSFETLMQRPRFETLDTGFNTDLGAFKPGAQYKQSSIGMRGQAIAFAWAATVVLAIGAGWFASELYRQAEEIAPTAANTSTDSAAPAGPAVPVLTSVPAGPGVAGAGSVASASDATRAPAPDQVALNAAGPADNARGGTSAASRKAARSDADAKPTRQVADAPALAISGDKAAAAPRENVATPAPSAAVAAASVLRSPDAPRVAQFAEGSASSDILLSARMLSDTSWRAITVDSARNALGGIVVRLHTMKVVGYSESADSLPQRIRMRQISEAGDTIDIIQTRPKSGTAPANTGALGRAPALLARVVVEGEAGRRYYETLKWSDDRLVTIVARDAATIRAVKDQLQAERD